MLVKPVSQTKSLLNFIEFSEGSSSFFASLGVLAAGPGPRTLLSTLAGQSALCALALLGQGPVGAESGWIPMEFAGVGKSAEGEGARGGACIFSRSRRFPFIFSGRAPGQSP